MDLVELRKIGRNLITARAKLDTITQLARDAAFDAQQAGIPETKIAVALGVDRLTIRRWLGK